MNITHIIDNIVRKISLDKFKPHIEFVTFQKHFWKHKTLTHAKNLPKAV